MTSPVGIDIRSLALFRIGLGSILLVKLFQYLGGGEEFLTDDGVFPRWLAVKEFTHFTEWSLSFINGSYGFQFFLLSLTGLMALWIVLGYKTRIACFTAALMLISFQNRNPYVTQGGDTVLNLMLLWGALLPLDRFFSIRHGPWVPRPESNTYCSIISLGVLLQIAFIYWFAAMQKLSPHWLTVGDATYFALALDEFATPLGLWLRQYQEVCRYLTYATFWGELLGPVLLFLPWRTNLARNLAVLGFFTLHIGFALCLELGPFSAIMLVFWILPLSSEFWNFITWFASKLGQRFAGYYDVADIQVTSFVSLVCWSAEEKKWTEGIFEGLSLILIIFFFLIGVGRVETSGFGNLLPKETFFVSRAFNVGQTWKMFAPAPRKRDGWFVVRATFVDGTEWDLFQDLPMTYRKPSVVSATFPTHFWRRYLSKLISRPDQDRQDHALCYWVRQWEDSHGEKHPPLKKAQLLFMEEYNRIDGPPSSANIIVLSNKEITN